MHTLVIKYAVSAAVVVAVAEIAKRSTLTGALVASLPLTSILAMVWLYHDTRDSARVAELATGIFWLVLPSLALFLSLPWLLRSGWGFYPALGVSAVVTVCAYGAMSFALRSFGAAA